MAKKRKASKKYRLSGRRFLTLAIAGLIAYYGYAYDAAYTMGPQSSRIFAAFAKLPYSADQIGRMRNSAFPPKEKPSRTQWNVIARVLDGDTIVLDNGQTVRLLGVDTPESSENRKMYTDLGKMNLADAKGDLIALGKAASRATRDKARGKRCWLEFDRNPRDQYERLLAVVHLEDGTILNEWLLSEGYAKAYIDRGFRYGKRYVALQIMARQNGAGFWDRGEEHDCHGVSSQSAF